VPNKYISVFGIFLLIPGILVLLATFFPVLKAETGYQVSRLPFNQKVKITPTPVDPNFNIYISKINANTPVVKNVSPTDSGAYQLALTRGVAHAAGTALPNQPGNTFIFAHSAGNWYQANRYNAVFYLLNKLVKNDQIILTYLSNTRTYQVTGTKVISAKDLSYLAPTKFDQLTLMTCWPPGTTLKRLIVTARPLN